MSSDLSKTSFPLNTGTAMPAVGLGTWQSSDDVAVQAVTDALNSGYRHIDTAFSYGNETPIGQAIRASDVPRSAIFVTDKLAQTWHSRAAAALDNSLAALGTGYLDLWLMHWPVALNPHGNHPLNPTRDGGDGNNGGTTDYQQDWDFLRTWQAMEDVFLAPGQTKVRAIGVSNCSTVHLAKLLAIARVVPAVNQVELHPFLPQPQLAAFCRDKGIQLAAYSPLGGSGSGNRAPSAFVLADPRIQTLAAEAGLTAAQLILSWGVQKGWAVLPKSSSPERIQSNLDIRILPDNIMKGIDALGVEVRRTCQPSWTAGVF